MRANKKALSGAGTPGRAAHDGMMHASLCNSSIPQKQEKQESLFIRIPEMMELMDCSRSTAQRCAASINARLKAEGKFTIAGRCNRKAFYEAVGYETGVKE